MNKLKLELGKINWVKIENTARDSLKACFSNDLSLFDSYEIPKKSLDDIGIECSYKCVHFNSSHFPEIAFCLTLTGYFMNEVEEIRDALFTYQYIVPARKRVTINRSTC